MAILIRQKLTQFILEFAATASLLLMTSLSRYRGAMFRMNDHRKASCIVILAETVSSFILSLNDVDSSACETAIRKNIVVDAVDQCLCFR